jgi:hypothetical protein
MLADVFPTRSGPPRQGWQRTGATAAVVALHLLLLFLLLNAVVAGHREKLIPTREIEIFFPQPPKSEKKEKVPPKPPDITAIQPETTAPITIPPLTTARPHASEDDGIGRLGHYLNNCSAGNFGALSQQEWANCLGGMATIDRNGNTIKLGDVRSLWEKQHPQQQVNPNEAHGFVECAAGDPRKLMGVPCFQFNGNKPSVANGQQ